LSNWSVVDSHSNLTSLFSKLPADYFKNERWFADRGALTGLSLVESLIFQEDGPGQIFLALNLFQLESQSGYFYYIPFLIAREKLYPEPQFLFETGGYYFHDGIPTREYVYLLKQLVRNKTSFTTNQGVFEFHSYVDLDELTDFGIIFPGGTSNSLLIVSNKFLIKNYRRIFPGINPELETCVSLTKVGAMQMPALYGFFQYRSTREFTLGIIQEVIINQGTGWGIWGDLLKENEPRGGPEIRKQAATLGKTLIGLHHNLAQISRQEGNYFPMNSVDIQKRYAYLQGLLQREQLPFFDDYRDLIIRKLSDIKFKLLGKDLGNKFKIHGDLHLEQVLSTKTGWKIIDFEGEPIKTIEERGEFDSPLKDLASMLRSISYRIKSVIGDSAAQNELEDLLVKELVNGYIMSYQGMEISFLPGNFEFNLLLTFFQIERAVCECLYESKYRPDWFGIPFGGLLKLLDSDLHQLSPERQRIKLDRD
jgi:maltokinase